MKEENNRRISAAMQVSDVPNADNFQKSAPAHLILAAGCIFLATAALFVPLIDPQENSIPLYEQSRSQEPSQSKERRIIPIGTSWVYSDNVVRLTGSISMEFRCGNRGLTANMYWPNLRSAENPEELEFLPVSDPAKGRSEWNITIKGPSVKWRMTEPGRYSAENPMALIYALATTDSDQAIFIFGGSWNLLGVPRAGFSGSMSKLRCMHPADG